MTDDAQRESEIKGKQKREEREELLEKVQKAREGRQRHQSPPIDDEGQVPRPPIDDEGQVPRPPRDDPRFSDSSVPPEQTDVPAGGTTGGAMGTSSKRKKDHPG